MGFIHDILQWHVKRLFPTDGRAFNVPMPSESGDGYTDESSEDLTDETGSSLVAEDYVSKGGILYRVIRAITVQFSEAWQVALDTRNSQLPDNDGFTIEDARVWYRRLRLYDSGSVPLADMKAAIAQRLSFPEVPLNKQSPAYIQEQLRAAGFDVYVYKNKFPDGLGGWITKTPGEVFGSTSPVAMCGYPQSGQVQSGQTSGGRSGKIVTYLEQDKDALFVVGSSLRATFFVSGSPITTPANVPLSRQLEFKQLLLKLKRAEAVAFTSIIYT
jgi:hypothetical protein